MYKHMLMFIIMFVHFLFLTKDFINRCPKSILLENTFKKISWKRKKANNFVETFLYFPQK